MYRYTSHVFAKKIYDYIQFKKSKTEVYAKLGFFFFKWRFFNYWQYFQNNWNKWELCVTSAQLNFCRHNLPVSLLMIVDDLWTGKRILFRVTKRILCEQSKWCAKMKSCLSKLMEHIWKFLVMPNFIQH